MKIFEISVKILQVASEQGVPIYSINASNVDAILPRLQVSQEVRDAVRNAVVQGREVIIPERNIQYYNWTGIGYIVLDPETGAGAYMISGGKAGGDIAVSIECDPVTQTLRIIIKLSDYTIGLPLIQMGAWIKANKMRGFLPGVVSGLGSFITALTALNDFMYYLAIGEKSLAKISLLLSVITILSIGLIMLTITSIFPGLGFLSLFGIMVVVSYGISLLTSKIMKWIENKTIGERKCLCTPCPS